MLFGLSWLRCLFAFRTDCIAVDFLLTSSCQNRAILDYSKLPDPSREIHAALCPVSESKILGGWKS
jgi:hypothetical protein